MIDDWSDGSVVADISFVPANKRLTLKRKVKKLEMFKDLIEKMAHDVQKFAKLGNGSGDSIDSRGSYTVFLRNIF